MSKLRRVTFTAEEIKSFGTTRQLESKVCERLRDHNIPVLGRFHFMGVREGALKVVRLDHGGAEFLWWPSTKDALDDGVLMPDSPGDSAAAKELIVPFGTTK